MLKPEHDLQVSQGNSQAAHFSSMDPSFSKAAASSPLEQTRRNQLPKHTAAAIWCDTRCAERTADSAAEPCISGHLNHASPGLSDLQMPI
uniref:Uncharacterized protein n=1 Tax=Aegilops tauschii subsp. strangulata TaxID=200361 RepID=A0A453A4C5_AEGTS